MCCLAQRKTISLRQQNKFNMVVSIYGLEVFLVNCGSNMIYFNSQVRDPLNGSS